LFFKKDVAAFARVTTVAVLSNPIGSKRSGAAKMPAPTENQDIIFAGEIFFGG
jgi:hypothetical protein